MKRLICRLSALILMLALLATSASALTVDEALTLLDESYLLELPEQVTQAESLDALFSLIGDPYTYYLSAEEYQAFLDSVEGTEEVVGIGVMVRFTEEGILITDVIKDGSAQRAGLMAGDLIVAVDGTSCVPAHEGHQAMITGPSGTRVKITVLRDGVQEEYVLLRLHLVILNTEVSLLDDHIGYIECTSFGSDTGELFAEGIQRYDSQADCWLVDVRSNSGGYSDAAVAAVSTFAGAGPYLFLRDKWGRTSYYIHDQQAVTDKAVVVLVDEGSASASEALAASLRDSGRAIIVGGRTYGKGVAQIVLDKDSHPELFQDDALKITAYRFYSLAGNTTDRIGVIPTLMVPNEYASDVAKVLCSAFRTEDLVTEGQLMLCIAGQYFYLELDTLDATTAAQLLSALPPSAQLWVGENTYYWTELTVENAAALLNTTYTSRSFYDVADSPYADAINTLATYSLLLGDGTGNFLPEARLTRAHACAMLAQLMNLSYTGVNRFADVPDSAWYADEVNALAELGLVEGVGNNLFRPDQVLSQQEFFTILGRTARYLNFNVDDYTYSFYDSEGKSLLNLYPELDAFAHWAKEEVAVLAWSSEVFGRVDSMLFADLTELTPTAPILREEAAACIYQMLNITGILPV